MRTLQIVNIVCAVTIADQELFTFVLTMPPKNVTLVFKMSHWIWIMKGHCRIERNSFPVWHWITEKKMWRKKIWKYAIVFASTQLRITRLRKYPIGPKVYLGRWLRQVHVHCPVCKQVQISYVIRSHIDQNTQDSRTTARVTKENGLSHQEKGPFL